MTEPILSVRNLTATFGQGASALRAVNEVSFDVMPGEVLGLVGESGSGKSVTLRSLLRLLPVGGHVGGSVSWHGKDIVRMTDAELRAVRGGQISMIFQEPMTALNPVLPVRVQIEENLRAHTQLDRKGRNARAKELMDLVGIPDSARRLDEFPHQFSGGMRQRVMIAIALASDPKLLLADEPTTALDVTIQDQILNLILDLRDELAMSVVLVTHDLGVVAATCDRMAVMYAGRIVEEGDVTQVFAQPRHAYTRGLLGSIPQAGTERSMLLSIDGTPPGLAAIPQGCAFNPRCDFATDICRRTRPHLTGDGHRAACHNSDAVIAAGSPVKKALSHV
ncbi:peptide/nickel transport system ATP-binding protein/oligopeptide transport system ATP-binding protein [Loktanella atrilutea]|uniref:Peptide/nickel transport system ATP-binding protein/oligopeptide transport system ATP-binding protein n=1 Tax=Loktanella atrilutea TaxID=366533 RepID=A0A1M4U442_LOKAT|nr:ABC transporter ATP-binding protein [Loktanella atrilutea]SHE51571.1 peptide/nickel transport system ATP-binding protein/oligopeptide transport system ATP-binding protein [Loktanella atrilutea]